MGCGFSADFGFVLAAKALNATTDENRLLHQEEQAKQLGLIPHTEEVALRSNQLLAFDPAASVLKSTQALVALKKKKAKKKQEEEERGSSSRRASAGV